MRQINFLRERQIDIARRKLVCRVYTIRLGILLAVAVVGIIPVQSTLMAARHEYWAATKDTRAVEKRVKAEREMKDALGTQSAQAVRFADAERRTQAWRRVIGELARRMPDDVWVTAIKSQAEGNPVVLTLTCQSTSLDVATQYIMALKQSDVFTSAKLATTRRSGTDTGTAIGFECVVSVDPKVLGPPASTPPPPPPPKDGGKGKG